MILIRTIRGRTRCWMAPAVILGVLTLVLPIDVEGQQSAGGDGLNAPPISLSMAGLPGVIAIPNAGTIAPGYAHLSYNRTPNYGQFSPGAIAGQHNIQFAVGLFSRIVISGRGSEVVSSELQKPIFIRNAGVIELVERTWLARDLSANLQLLLLEESASLPAIAIGAQDFGGASNLFEARYGVVSKTFWGRARLSAGYGWDAGVLRGFFGGIEASPIRQVTLLGDYDAERFRGGLRLQPFPESLVRRGAPRPTVDVIWTEGEGVTWAVSLRAALDQDWVERGPRSAQRLTPLGTDPEVSTVAVLAQLLSDDGFENISVSVREGDLLRIEYENRRYNQHELDGLARVLRRVGHNLPEGVEGVRIVLKQTNVRALQVDLTSEDLLRFLEGAIRPEVFQERVSVRYPEAPRSLTGPIDRSVNSSFFKADLTLNPLIETLAFWDLGVFDARFSLQPNLRFTLFSGTVLEAQYLIPIGQTEHYRMGPSRSTLPEAELDRALLHHARWWSLSGRSALVAQWSVGRFDLGNVGIRQEASLSLWGGLVTLGADVAAVGYRRQKLDRLLALGRARLLVPSADARLTVTAGRFLDEDHGVVVDVSRFFADTEIGLVLRHSDRGSVAGIRIALPLTFGRDLPPSRVRVRAPAEWRYGQQSIVFADRNIIRGDVARSLPPRSGLHQIYLDRDRLHPASVKAAVADPRFWR